MKLTVEFFGPLRGRVPKGVDDMEIDVADDATVNDVFRFLGLQEGEIFGASVDGYFVERTRRLAQGQRVLIFPPMAGG
jgi:molybdopterin converting factor small subunit